MSLSPFNLIGLSCQSLLGNPLRSSLTIVGVFMGVAAVSATLQVRSISQAVIAQQLAERNAPQVGLVPQRNRITRQRIAFTLEDIEFLKRRLKQAKAISGINWMRSSLVVFQDKEATPNMIAVAPNHLETSGQQLVAGRAFNSTDYQSFRPVVMIDEYLAKQLFQQQNPLGQNLYIDLKPYSVVGILPTSAENEEPEGEVWMTTAFQSTISGNYTIRSILIRPQKLEDLQSLEEQAIQLLEQRYKGSQFWSWNTVEEILEQKNTLESVSTALLVVGAISLLVGGVGIANVTIASVIERTPEIGLRRAIGATQKDVMLQFILEAAILSLVGGSLAIATVHGLTVIVAQRFEFPYAFESRSAAIALSSAVFVGVGAGFFPSLRASQLDPVKALKG
ncbi:ABC transporter permease [Lyngbya sp. PCC 8106]|uniref:ABC transporter permease n=1 Tax=Lyngbya sp. (strain PCC 8106) TaxID=313612 RepID=UPI0000EAB6CC|nr:ABC transporter permease [Lyngbya sp. PCC 8106]EAW34450.1 Macrolide specific ABC-type transporter, ATP-binding protein [Lyngbya sp. PCC 8106]